MWRTRLISDLLQHCNMWLHQKWSRYGLADQWSDVALLNDQFQVRHSRDGWVKMLWSLCRSLQTTVNTYTSVKLCMICAVLVCTVALNIRDVRIDLTVFTNLCGCFVWLVTRSVLFLRLSCFVHFRKTFSLFNRMILAYLHAHYCFSVLLISSDDA